MSEIIDRGNCLNKINSWLADIVTILIGRKANYTLRYMHHRRRLPDFNNPKDLSERVLSSMLKDDFQDYSIYADKVKVHEFVDMRGLGHILLKQYAFWENAEEIDFFTLPEKFILKTNNGCGGHYVCTNKALIDEPRVRRLMAKELNNTKLSRTEPQYSKIKPLIFAEELIGDGINLPEDYKFYCINGKVDHVMVICDRKDGSRKVITLDNKWNVLNYVPKERMPQRVPAMPKNFDVMVKYAERLSFGFEFVRVD